MARCRRAAAPPGLTGRLQPGDQVPEPLGAADPGRVHERGQPQQLRAISQPGRAQPGGVQPRQPAPAVQRADQRVRQIPAAGIGPAADQSGPGESCGRQQPAMVAGKHRHPAASRAPHPDDDATGAGRSRRCRARRAGQCGSARRRPQADQACRAHPPLPSGLGVRQPEEPADLRRAVRLLDRSRGSGTSAGYNCGTTRRAMNRWLVRSVRRATPGQARRAPGEPLDHRRMEHIAGVSVQARDAA